MKVRILLPSILGIVLSFTGPFYVMSAEAFNVSEKTLNLLTAATILQMVSGIVLLAIGVLRIYREFEDLGNE